jgi:16S rRNA (adenine1518-N6/adenine1519-N6)-dimethyltransferase
LSSEIFEVFDEKNHRVGEAVRGVVHTRGLFHRSVHVWVFNSQDKVLLQQRATHKDVAPSLWDLSVAEHAKPGETGFQTALRGAREELTIRLAVRLVADYRLNCFEYPELGIFDNEFVQTYQARHDGPFILDEKEVQSIKFVTMDKLFKQAREKPELFTPWLHRDLGLFEI